MLVTQFAMMDPGPAGESLASRIGRAIAHFFGFGDPPLHASRPQPQASLDLASADVPEGDLHIVRDVDPGTVDTSFRWRRHEQLRQRPTSSLPDEERQARHHAVRGLYAARAGALDAAEHHFICAAECPEIDLTAIPGFWQLDRGAMLTAVRAYEAAGRLRDASALTARIRTALRPRSLAPVPENVTELPMRRLPRSASS